MDGKTKTDHISESFIKRPSLTFSPRISRCFFIIFMAICLGLSITGQGLTNGHTTKKEHSEATLHHVILQLTWLHQFQFAGYYAAVEKGFYRDAGFDATILEGGPERRPFQEVVSGRANYGVGRGEILLHRLKEKPVVVLAALFQHSAVILLAKKESGIDNPQRMIGRRVMLLEGDDSAEYIAMFRKEGVSLNQIRVIPSSYNVNDLIIGKTDVFNAYSTNEPFYLEQRGIPATIISPRTYGIDFYGDCLFTSEREIKEHPDQVKAFREASLRGWEYAMANPEEIIEVILSKYGVQKTRDHLRFEAKAIRELMLPDLIEIGHMNPGRWHHMAGTYVELGMIAPGYSLEDFIYDPNPIPDYTWVRWVVGIAGTMVLLISLASTALLFFNKKLQREVQERKIAEEALRAGEEKYRTLFEGATNPITILDKDGVLLMINPAGADLLNLSPQSCIGKSIFELIPKADRSRLDIVQKVVDTGKEASVENLVELQSGPRWFLSVYQPILDISGRTYGVQIISYDISSRKQMEEEVLKSKKLESIGTLAGGIAHDFNNLLSVILGNLSLAQQEDVEPVRTYKFLKEAEKASLRAKDLTSRLITFSNGGEPVKKAASVEGLIKELILTSFSDSGVDWDISIPEDLSMVEMDKGQVKQVIHNIIINAVEAMNGKGTVRVYGKNIMIPENNSQPLNPGKYVKISIKDQGVGIPEENLSKIFDPYFSTKGTGTRKGMGLGLSVCNSIIKKHDGWIAVESELGMGTTVIIFLPASDKDLEGPESKYESDADEPSIGRGKVLLMDDEEMIRDLATHVLRQLGYCALVCKDGKEAIELYKKAKASQEPFDAIILDLTNQFGMGGKETMQKILEIDPQAKGIVSTGYSNNPILGRFRDYGFCGVLIKPYTITELSKVLHEVIPMEKKAF